MKLYRVQIELEVLVVAESQTDAEHVAIKNYHAIMRNESDGVEVYASPARSIPPEWKGALPYGGDGETPVEEYLPTPTPKTEGGET